MAKKMYISVPIADLRTIPSAYKGEIGGSLLSKDNPGADSQLLWGDSVDILEEITYREEEVLSEKWIKVNALEQPAFLSTGWGSCLGFVKAQEVVFYDEAWNPNAFICSLVGVLILPEKKEFALSFGTKIEITPNQYNANDDYLRVRLVGGIVGMMLKRSLIPIESFTAHDRRKHCVAAAKLFIGSPYIWGGCSGYDKANKDHITGVDCSGLVYLIHKIIGIQVPRNSRAQCEAAKKVINRELRPGDLIFSAVYEEAQKEWKVVHVFVVADEGALIESTGKGCSSVSDIQDPSLLGTVITPAQEHKSFKKPLKAIKDGDFTTQGNKIFLRTFFDD